ncbi:MAG: hypothetical protein QXZ66_07355 [Thermoproteota archaeon]
MAIARYNFEAIKIRSINNFLEKHISNLKPLVGFNTINAQQLFLELINILLDYPTLRDLEIQGSLSALYERAEKYAEKIIDVLKNEVGEDSLKKRISKTLIVTANTREAEVIGRVLARAISQKPLGMKI